MKKVRAAYLVIMLLFMCCTSTNESFQKDADIIRLRHIRYYGEILEEYFRKNNKYPFQGETTLPVYVFIANDHQIKYTNQKIPYSHKVVPLKDFVNEIESGIGRTIEEYYDPQNVPVNKPNFYLYMINKDTYFFAVHVHQPFPFSRKIEENYYKIEISNHPDAHNKTSSLKELADSKSFIAEMTKTPTKEGFFLEREKEYLYYTKQNNAG